MQPIKSIPWLAKSKLEITSPMETNRGSASFNDKYRFHMSLLALAYYLISSQTSSIPSPKVKQKVVNKRTINVWSKASFLVAQHTKFSSLSYSSPLISNNNLKLLSSKIAFPLPWSPTTLINFFYPKFRFSDINSVLLVHTLFFLKVIPYNLLIYVSS